MQKLTFYFGVFALAAALSAALPAIAHAKSADSAHVQLLDGLGRVSPNSEGNAADVAALLAYARHPDSLNPKGIAEVGTTDSALADRIVAANTTKNLPDKLTVLYRLQHYVIGGQDYAVPPAKDLRNDTHQEIELLEGVPTNDGPPTNSAR